MGPGILGDKGYLSNLEKYYDYDGWETRYNHYLRIALMDRIFGSFDTKGNALDVGCSAGAQSFSLERNGFSVTGIDLGEKDLDKARDWARSVGSKCEFKAMDISKTDFADGTFDLVLCSEVMEHVIEQGKVANEIFRITKRGGHIIYSMPNGESKYWRRKKREMGWKKMDTNVDKKVVGSSEWHSLRHFVFNRDAIERITSNGLRLKRIRIESCGYSIPPLSIGIRFLMGTGLGYKLESIREKKEEKNGATYIVIYQK